MDAANGQPDREDHRRRYELRNALTVVSGRVQLLRKRVQRGDGPEQVLPRLEAIEAALARLTERVDHLDGAD